MEGYNFVGVFDYLMPIISGIFGGLGGFFFGRGKYKAEVRGIEASNDTEIISNAISIINLYKQELNELQARNDTKFNELNNMYNDKIELLREEIKLHKRTISFLKRENASLRKKIKGLE